MMRSSAKYIWIFIVAAFVLGFMLYESAGLFGLGGITTSTAVATVNGEDILFTRWQQLIQETEQQQTQGSGRSITLDERRQIEQQAFDELVNRALLAQEIRRRGISVTNDEIVEAAKYNPPRQLLESPELQTNGQFDIAKYQRLLASPQAAREGLLRYLEETFRTQIPQQKLFEQVAASVYPSDAQLWSSYRDARDSAEITYAVGRPKEVDPSIQVTDAEIRAYYDAHKKELERTGRALVTIALIPRTVSAADSAAVRARAVQLRERILAGEKFEDVARAESADSGSATRGGDLGKGVKGRFVAPFEAAAQTLKAGEISQPVLTQFGYHLIRLDSRKGDTLALHHILLRVTQSDSAAARTDRRADSLSKIAANADQRSRFDAAVKLLKLQTVGAEVTEGAPVTVNGQIVPSVSAWAFSGTKPGESSDLFDDDNGYYLARLESVTPGGSPSLDAARNDIRQHLAMQKQLDALVEPARKLAIAAAGSSLEQAATVLHTTVTKAGPFARVSTVPDVGTANEVIGAAFALPVGKVSAPIKTDNGVYVIRVDRRVEASRATFDSVKVMLRRTQFQRLQQDRVRQFLADLRDAAKIEDHRKDIETMTRRSKS